MPVYVRDMKTTSIFYSLLTVLLRAALLAALVVPGWLVYRVLPRESSTNPRAAEAEATLQIVLRPPANNSDALDISVELYPFDIVAARHEYFTERRAGKSYPDFMNERMKGRTTVVTKLDKQGQASINVSPGTWWLHAQLSGDENLEWRLPLNVTGGKQTVELTLQNIYTRSKSF
jgi:hypothetical protein